MPFRRFLSITQRTESVETRLSGGETIALPYLWLRDNCGCADCRNPQTTEKVFVVANVAVDLRPSEINLINDELNVTWPDGHVSLYSSSYIDSVVTGIEPLWTPWNADFEPARIKYQAFLTDDLIAVDAIADFQVHGACIFSSAPVMPGTLENLAPRLGPIREVLFDRIHNVEVDPNGYNVAHTALEILPHNDFASYSWPPSVQALHMLINDAKGGESTIVDGWNVLENLRDERPELFESLCTMPVPFREFDDDNETYAVAPLVRLDTKGNIAGLRYSNQLMQVINPSTPGLDLFYRSYHELCRRITDPAVKASFRLQAGEILLVSGHRVLHGRRAFEPSGKRHLQDAYFELDNVINHRVVLQRKGRVTK